MANLSSAYQLLTGNYERDINNRFCSKIDFTFGNMVLRAQMWYLQLSVDGNHILHAHFPMLHCLKDIPGLFFDYLSGLCALCTALHRLKCIQCLRHVCTTTRNVFLVFPFVYSLQKTLQLQYNIAFRHRYVCVLHWYIKIFKSWKDMFTGINPWVFICKLVLTMPWICFVLTSIYNLNRLCS